MINTFMLCFSMFKNPYILYPTVCVHTPQLIIIVAIRQEKTPSPSLSPPRNVIVLTPTYRKQ